MTSPRVVVCPPNRRTRPPGWGRRLRAALEAALRWDLPDGRLEAYVLEVMCSGLAPLVFEAQRRGTDLPQLAPRRHPCLYHLPEGTP